MKIDRFVIARLARVHPGSVACWLREGLAGACVRPGGPGRAALFDAKRTLTWLAERKKIHHTLADVRALVRSVPTHPAETRHTAPLERSTTP